MIESFLQYLQFEKNYSLHTVESYRNDLYQFKDHIFENDVFDPEVVTAALVRSWIVYLMANDYSATSVNRKLSSLKSFFRYLNKKRLLFSNPAKNVLGPKSNKPLPVFVPDADLFRLFSHWDDDSYEGLRDVAILDLFYSTGIRCAELVGLKEKDVDFASGMIKVKGKRNKERFVPFSENLAASLVVYKESRDENIECKESDSFFIRKNGKSLSNFIVYEIVKKRLSEISGLSKRSPHVLRHTFATSMMNHGADLRAVKELLGHASLSSTEVYTHTTFEELKKTYQQAHPRAENKGGIYGN